MRRARTPSERANERCARNNAPRANDAPAAIDGTPADHAAGDDAAAPCDAAAFVAPDGEHASPRDDVDAPTRDEHAAAKRAARLARRARAPRLLSAA